MSTNVTFKPLENNKLKVGFIQILKQENIVLSRFYDPTMKGGGDTASWISKGTNPRTPYYEGIKHSDFKTSPTYTCHIFVFGFGNYGDKISRDFAYMAINEIDLLDEFIDAHIKGIRSELNYDILRKFKQDFDNDAGWNPAAVLKNPEELFETGRIGEKDAAKLFFNSVMTNGMRMCQRSDKFNSRKVNSNASSLKEFVFFCTFKTYSMVKTDLYAAVYHNEQVALESIFGGVGIMDFSYNKIQNMHADDASVDLSKENNFGRGDEKLVESKKRAMLVHKDSYKIMDTINPPLFIDTNFMGVSLHTYFFKWFYAFCGRIDFVNQVCWVSEGNKLNLEV